MNAIELPELQGTEKQVAWANEIRNKQLDTKQPMWNHSDLGEWLYAGNEELTEEQIAKAFEWYSCGERLQARWWINNRDGNPLRMMIAIGKTPTTKYSGTVEEIWA